MLGQVVRAHPPKPESDFGNGWKLQEREKKRAHNILSSVLGNHHLYKATGGCVRQCVMTQLAILSCQPTRASHIREDLRLSGRCGQLSSANGLNRMSSDALKVVRAVMKEVTHGLARTMPPGRLVEVFVVDTWHKAPTRPPFNMCTYVRGTPKPFGISLGRFLFLRLFLNIIPFALCILQSPVIAFLLPYHSLSLTALAFYTTVTSVAVHLPSGPIIFTSFVCDSSSSVSDYNMGAAACRMLGFLVVSRKGNCRWCQVDNGLIRTRAFVVWFLLGSRPLWGMVKREALGEVCLVGLTRPIASECHHEGVSLLPTQLGALQRSVWVAIRLMGGGLVSIEKEVLFIYTIKMSRKEIFSLSAHIPSLQLVIRLLDSTKGVTKGHVVVLALRLTHMSIQIKNLNLVERGERPTEFASSGPGLPAVRHPHPSSFYVLSTSGTNQDSIGSPSVGDSLNQELELVVPCITLKPEGEGGREEEEQQQMALNLRVDFKERQRKRHSEALSTIPPPAKKTPQRFLARSRFWMLLWCRCLLLMS
ncbi:hypothetical protein CK203_056782 [Vitis vinifera]|uniref:Uncharacterized protein n=1 Tax=Vitis vinifera TaxID=29760 RepID=A0A438FVD6_VITVI|nr:hypothetical protein CK203_056782 [Vitis vinifera]